MQNAVKKHMLEAKIFHAIGNSAEDIEEDIEKKNKITLDLPTIQSYSHVVTMVHMYWTKTNVTKYLELLVLFYLHYSL